MRGINIPVRVVGRGVQPDSVVLVGQVVGAEPVEGAVLRQQGGAEVPARLAALRDLLECKR